MRQPLLSIQLYDTYDIINKKKRIRKEYMYRKAGDGSGEKGQAGVPLLVLLALGIYGSLWGRHFI